MPSLEDEPLHSSMIMGRIAFAAQEGLDQINFNVE